MYKNRVKISPDELNYRHKGAKYLITNRVIGGSFIFGDIEKEKFLNLIIQGQKRHSYKLLDFVLMDNHYHCLIEIPPPEEMSHGELLKRWIATRRSTTWDEPGKNVLDAYREKIHDLSFIVGNFEQRFVQWYNKRKHRLGSLFNRFDSVIVGDGAPTAALMAYITLNPVRANIVDDPVEYHWCGYAHRVAKGYLNEHDLELVEQLHRALHLPQQILRLETNDQIRLLWKYFRVRLMKASLKAHTAKGDWPSGNAVGNDLKANNRSLELGKADHFMLKIRFATKGIAIGTEVFVEDILGSCGKVLGYKREHHACEHHIWDHVYSLKKHRHATF